MNFAYGCRSTHRQDDRKKGRNWLKMHALQMQRRIWRRSGGNARRNVKDFADVGAKFGRGSALIFNNLTRCAERPVVADHGPTPAAYTACQRSICIGPWSTRNGPTRSLQADVRSAVVLRLYTLSLL
jgi:hypothetical protein